jgi:hypothetical protein
MSDRLCHPCPFNCDAEKEYQPEYVGGDVRAVECTWCGALGPPGETEEEAVANWNKAGEVAKNNSSNKNLDNALYCAITLLEDRLDVVVRVEEK